MIPELGKNDPKEISRFSTKFGALVNLPSVTEGLSRAAPEVFEVEERLQRRYYFGLPY